MVYAILYPHDLDDEQLLYSALSNIDIDNDYLIIDNRKHRRCESLILLMAQKLGIRIIDGSSEPIAVADKTIVLYPQHGDFEIHNGNSCITS